MKLFLPLKLKLKSDRSIIILPALLTLINFSFPFSTFIFPQFNLLVPFFSTLHFSGAPKAGSFSKSKIRPEQKRKRHHFRLEGKLPLWTGPIQDPLFKNTREGKREAYRRRPIIPQRPVVPFLGPIIVESPEQEEANRRRAFELLDAAAPPPRTFFPTPAQLAEFRRQIEAPPDGDYRVTRGLFTGPRQHRTSQPTQAAAEVQEEGAVGGTEEIEEGKFGGESSDDDTLQVLCESLSLEEQTPAPIPPTPTQIEPTRQGRSRGRGLLMYSAEGLEEIFRETPRQRSPTTRQRSKSRIAWIRRLEEQ